MLAVTIPIMNSGSSQIEHRSNAVERVGKDHSGIAPVGHDLVKALAHSLNCLEAAFGLNRTKELDDHWALTSERGVDFMLGKHAV